MNKAFIKESADDTEPERETDASVPGGRNYLTPPGFARLQAEHRRLASHERPAALSEAGNPRWLREIDRRLRFLTERLASAEVIDPAAIQSDQVVFGATVTVCDEQGVEKRYAIVGIDEADASRGLIAWTAPLARSLLGARAGEAVTFHAPQGSQELEVVKIEYLA